MVSKHGNKEQCQFIPDCTVICTHVFASGPAVETQLSWLFLWLFLIIPNYSYYAYNPNRSNGHSLGNQLPQKRAIACRGPEDHCPLLCCMGQQIPGNPGYWWKESVVFCCLCLSALQLGIIRIIKIIVIIGIIEIISKILLVTWSPGAGAAGGSSAWRMNSSRTIGEQPSCTWWDP